MEKRIGQKWLLIIFLVVTGAAFSAMVYRLVAAIRSPDVHWQTTAVAATLDDKPLPAPKKDQIQYMNLKRDQERSIGNIRITYKGLADDHIEMDLVVMPLDPQAAYRYRLSVKSAKKGFTLFQQKLTLITARKGRIRIAVLPGAKTF